VQQKGREFILKPTVGYSLPEIVMITPKNVIVKIWRHTHLEDAQSDLLLLNR
jgi:hypothetical protein